MRARFGLLLYGELSLDEEERVESHLDRCPECRAAFAQEKAMHSALDGVELAPPPELLSECREELAERIRNVEPPPAPGWWDRFVDAITLRPSSAWMRPVGVMALVAIGFGAGKMTPPIESRWIPMGLADAIPGHVRYVERAPDGKVQIIVDETRQRIVSGRLDDPPVRSLLLSATKDPNDPALRAETVEILNPRAGYADVRGALIFALEHDPNDGVRLKALDGLKPFATAPEVKRALKAVLLGDSNNGLQAEAIDLLAGGDPAVMDRETVATLQELMERGEQLTYVRERCVKLLKAVNASAEIY